MQRSSAFVGQYVEDLLFQFVAAMRPIPFIQFIQRSRATASPGSPFASKASLASLSSSRESSKYRS